MWLDLVSLQIFWEIPSLINQIKLDIESRKATKIINNIFCDTFNFAD